MAVRLGALPGGCIAWCSNIVVAFVVMVVVMVAVVVAVRSEVGPVLVLRCSLRLF
jgi:hypothetical protein